MSAFPSGGEALGSASFGLHADGLSEFQREMNQAGNAVDRFGDRAADAVGEDGRKGGRFLGGIRSAVKGFRGLIGIAGGVASAIGIIAVAVETLTERFRAMDNARDEAFTKLAGMSTRPEDAASRMNATQAAIDELQGKIGWKRENPLRSLIGDLYGETEGVLQEQIRILRQGQNGASMQLRIQHLRSAAAPVATFGPSNSPAALGAMIRRSRGGGL